MNESKQIKFYPASEDALKLTLDKFINDCKKGYFIDEDGIGYYGTDTEESDATVFPSDVENNIIRKEFTHVYWYNR